MESPIRVPTVSTKAMMKMISTIGKNLRLRPPEMSSCIRMGERSGGRLTKCSGMAAALSQMESKVVPMMPMTMAPFTLLGHQHRHEWEAGDRGEHRGGGDVAQPDRRTRHPRGPPGRSHLGR